MTAPAFDEVETSQRADPLEGGDTADDDRAPSADPDSRAPSVAGYRIEGYSVDGYSVESTSPLSQPRPPRPPRSPLPGRRRGARRVATEAARPAAPVDRAADQRLLPDGLGGLGGVDGLTPRDGLAVGPPPPRSPAPRAPAARAPARRPARSGRPAPAGSAEPRPEGAGPSGRRPQPRRRPLRRRPKASSTQRWGDDRPYARLGLLWVIALFIGLVIGAPALAVVVAPVGVIAAASALRVARRDGGSDPARSSEPTSASPSAAPPAPTSGPESAVPGVGSGDEGSGPDATRPLHGAVPPDPHHLVEPRDLVILGRAITPSDVRTAVLGAVVLTPFVALGGPIVAVVAGLVVVAGAALASRALGCTPVAAALAVAAPISAMTSAVVARGQGFAVGLVLLAAVCFYDTAACLMGDRPTGGFLGVLSGLLSVGALGFLVTALANPPFGGDTPWSLCLMVGVLAWVGVKLSRLLMRGGPTLPGLARLDSLVVAGPAWVVAVATVLHR